MFYLYGIYLPHRDTLLNYRNLVVDIKRFFCSRSLTFDLCRLTFTFYNWTAGHAHSGSLQTSNVNSNVKRLRPQTILSISDNVSVAIQGVLVQHFLFFCKSCGLNNSRLMILISSPKEFLRFAGVCRMKIIKIENYKLSQTFMNLLTNV